MQSADTNGEGRIIERAFTAVLDAESYSTADKRTMARIQQSLLNAVDERYQAMTAWGRPNVIPTGDGVILIAGEGKLLRPEDAASFVRWVVDLTRDVSTPGRRFRSGITYQEREPVVEIPLVNIESGRAHVGSSISEATRLLDFCEPGEIQVTKKLIDFVGDPGRFVENPPYIAKHNLELRTYSYQPEESERAVLYAPEGPAHRFKRYRGFPKLDAAALEPFREGGLDGDVEDVVAHAYQATRSIVSGRWFVSHHSVFKILRGLMQAGLSQEALVVSRNDEPRRFWSHPESASYLKLLRKRFGQNGLRQRRLVVVDQPGDAAFEEQPLSDLKDAHARGTLFAIDRVTAADEAPFLNKLAYGCTVLADDAPGGPLAVIAFPPPNRLDVRELDHETLSSLVADANQRAPYREYVSTDGPLRAIVSANAADVESLRGEITRLLDMAEDVK